MSSIQTADVDVCTCNEHDHCSWTEEGTAFSPTWSQVSEQQTDACQNGGNETSQ